MFHTTESKTPIAELMYLLYKQRALTWELTKRDIRDRYVGQVLGVFWAIGHPIAMMTVYVFVFVVVFRIKMSGAIDVPRDFTTYILAGIIPWLGISESLGRGTGAIVGSANLVKQVVFPIEVLPVKAVLATVFTQIVMLGILTSYVLIRQHTLPWTYLLLPVLVAVQLVMMVGLALFLSALGPYFRDLKDVIQVMVLMGTYLIPAFYPPDLVPGLFKHVLRLNPFSHVVWCYQDVCYYGSIEHPWSWLIFPAFSVGSLYVGYRLFRKLKVMFGNVL